MRTICWIGLIPKSLCLFVCQETDDGHHPGDDVGEEGDPEDAEDQRQGVPLPVPRAAAVGDREEEGKADRPPNHPLNPHPPPFSHRKPKETKLLCKQRERRNTESGAGLNLRIPGSPDKYPHEKTDLYSIPDKVYQRI